MPLPMNWELQLHDIVAKYFQPFPTFEQWIDASGYGECMNYIRIDSETRARELRALYDEYLRDTGPDGAS